MMKEIGRLNIFKPKDYRKLYIALGLFFFFAFPSWISAQQVPARLMIGDVELHINESARRQIQKDVDRLTQSETYYNILVDRINLYFPLIEREHRKSKVPDEIKFLAVQESGLISDAVSVANAVGFWQFKDFTGREVGLRVDRQVDERLNVVASSRGSAKYFHSNNFFFDNWAYAVIAYQAGAAGAKAHTNSKNYGKQKLQVTLGTYWYLKKFIAHVVAFSPAVGRPHSDGLWLDEITNASGKSLEQIAREQKVELDELKKYNKWLKRGRVPEDKTYSVLIPRKGTPPSKIVASNKKSTPTKIDQPTEKVYSSKPAPSKTSNGSTLIPINGIPTILSKKADDIHSLSARAGISEKAFRKYNDLPQDHKIVPNDFYYIQKKKGWSEVEYHTVKRGESLWDIAQSYGIRLLSLAKKNRISSTVEIKTGRVLWLRKKRPSKTPIEYKKMKPPTPNKTPSKKKVIANNAADSKQENTEQQKAIVDQTNVQNDPGPIVVSEVDSSNERKKVKIHTVAQGETLTSIGQLYNLTMEDLLRWNELSNPNAISIGQNIQVKAPIDEVASINKVDTHIVQPKETLYGISRKYNMTIDELMDLNGKTTFDLNAGQELKVFVNRGDDQ